MKIVMEATRRGTFGLDVTFEWIDNGTVVRTKTETLTIIGFDEKDFDTEFFEHMRLSAHGTDRDIFH